MKNEDWKMEKHDINNLEDIQCLVDSFYGKIRDHELLGAIFNHVIQDRWPQHLKKMYSFWQTVLLEEERTYFGAPFPPHAKLPVSALHFDEWVRLWHETVDHYFEGIRADEAKWRGSKMATMFLSKIEYYQNHSSHPLM
ncbi:MAG TPA: group III truncated hemoglobin [Flavipsychrobacter sp.]|jgi:hemoglobin|nr:group III truncated hemoglobin [Flavipsychrobacter sp.]